MSLMPIILPNLPTLQTVNINDSAGETDTLDLTGIRESPNRRFIIVCYGWTKLSDFNGESYAFSPQIRTSGFSTINFTTIGIGWSGTSGYDSVQGIYIGHATVESNDYVNLDLNKSGNGGNIYGLFAAYNLNTFAPTSSNKSIFQSGSGTTGWSNLVIPSGGVRIGIVAAYGSSQPTLTSSNQTKVYDDDYGTRQHAIIFADYLYGGNADEDVVATYGSSQGAGYAYAAFS